MMRHLWKFAVLAGCAAAFAASGLATPAAIAEDKPAADDEQGFVSLFDGKTLKGWVGSVDGYAAEEGSIVCIPSKGGNLYTDKDYADFILRFEFQLTENANNGVGLRAPPTGQDAAYAGMELQVLDDGGSQYTKLQPYQYHGSVYGIVAAKRGALKPVGEWNVQEVYLNGRDIKVTLNGTVIVDANLDEASKNGTLDHKNHPGLANKTGRLAFLGHGHKVAFRNIRVKELNVQK